MNTIEIPERNIKAEYPSCWEEMDNGQFAFVMQNWLKVIDGKLNRHEFLIIILYKFLGIKRAPLDVWKDKRLSRRQLEDKFANIWQLTETITWLFREEDIPGQGTALILNYNEVTNRFPELENSNGVKIFGPDDGMVNITFGEYRRAWDFFAAYGEWKRDADLDMFIATLYRPERADYEQVRRRPDFDGKRRELFNPHLTQDYAKALKNIPFWQKLTIWLWFFNCDKFIKEEELEFGRKLINFAQLFSRKRNSEDIENLDENELGLTGLLYMIAESNLFGNPVQVDLTNYIDVLTALLYWQQQADKLKSKI